MSGNEQQKYATGMHLKRYMGNLQKQKWLPKGKVYITCPVGGIVHVWFTSGNLHVAAIGYLINGTSKVQVMLTKKAQLPKDCVN